MVEALPSKRVCRPTWKVLETAPIDSLSSSSEDEQISPVGGNDSCEPPTESVSNFFATPANQFGVVKEYQRQPAAVLITGTSTPPTTHRDVADIIEPYPTLSSFLFNLTWRRMKGVVSSSGRASIAKVLLDKCFKNEDLAGVDFAAIEKELAMDIQSPWGGNGWRHSTIIIEVPTGKKTTAASRCIAANARACNQRHDEVDPDADPFPVYKVPIHDVRTRSLTQTMLESIQDRNNSTALHWNGYKEVWQPPYCGAPPVS